MTHDKQTSSRVSAIASRMIRVANPLDNPTVRTELVAALKDINDRILSSDKIVPEREIADALVGAVRGVLDKYFADARSLAASALSQDEDSSQ